MMFDSLRDALLRLLRVPPEPGVPAAEEPVRVFRAAPAYYRYKVLLWAFAQGSALLGLIFGLFWLQRLANVPAAGEGSTLDFVLTLVRRVAVAGFVLQLPISFAVLRLDFQMRWYILSDRSLRIREGVLSLKEKTMTFANIQQIMIHQNPLQRMLGIANVQVRSAGGGGDGDAPGKGLGESMHEAWFRGVDNAEAVRSAIRERVRQHRDSGLGDPDDRRSTAVGGPAPVVEAAREVRAEVQRLHELVRSRGGYLA